MFPMKNGLNIVHFCMQVYTQVFQCNATYGGKFLKRVLASLYCTKCNEINIFYYLHNFWVVQ